MLLPDEAKTAIVRTLISQSLADHLGDVRDAERHLWSLLKVPDLPYSHPVHDSDSAYRITRARLVEGGLHDYLPDYAQPDDDDDA